MKGFALCLLLSFIISGALAQDIQVNRQNKTIAVTAEESVTADPEVAVVDIGYHNYAPAQDSAFQDNVREDEKWTPEMKRERQFEAQQSWHITLPVSRAQTIVDLAVKSGANEVDDVNWNVADPLALQAKASGAALAKARTIADQMAKGLGTKLGELVYASNRAPVAKNFFRDVTVNTEAAEISTVGDRKPQLTLFPQKVKSEATVYAVFAIE